MSPEYYKLRVKGIPEDIPTRTKKFEKDDELFNNIYPRNSTHIISIWSVVISICVMGILMTGFWVLPLLGLLEVPRLLQHVGMVATSVGFTLIINIGLSFKKACKHFDKYYHTKI